MTLKIQAFQAVVAIIGMPFGDRDTRLSEEAVPSFMESLKKQPNIVTVWRDGDKILVQYKEGSE